jgi:DNA polymerase I-like protein with 3'-5' exonuclease and polymerase domains
MSRRNSVGLFWEEIPVEKKRGAAFEAPRVLPSIPDTGWQPPKEFPRLDSAEIIGVDTETKDLELDTKGPGVRRGAHIVGLSVATEDRAWYFPMRHEIQPELNMDPELVMRWAGDNLSGNTPKVGANLLYDADFLLEEGVDIGSNLHDIQVAEALIDENRFSFSLEALAQDYLGTGKETSVLESWAHRAYGTRTDFRANIYRCPPSLVGPYAEADAMLPLQVLEQQRKRLYIEEVENLYEIERGLIPLLLGMRRRGVRVDLKRAAEVEGMLEKSIARDLAALRALVGMEVNVNAGESIAKAFDKMGLTYGITPKSKKPSFTKEFLEAHPHPAAKLITAVRGWQKLLGTFIRGYIYDLHVKGRIHCQFNQTKGDDFGAVSGRFSSSLPNLQNIPTRTEEGQLIRTIFLAEHLEDWGRFDWSQIEFRFLTHYAVGEGAEEAREMYRHDPTTDFHQMVSDMTGVRRKESKNINFALVYGQGKEATAQQIGIPLEEAEPIFEQYHSRLPFVRKTYNVASQEAADNGFIRTILGRKRRFDLWQPRSLSEVKVAYPLAKAKETWPDSRLKRAYTHKGLNARLQGSAADLMKLAMWQLVESGVFDTLGVPLLTVHDELDFSVPRTKAAKKALAEINRIMTGCLELSIPIMVAYEQGPNWGEAK